MVEGHHYVIKTHFHLKAPLFGALICVFMAYVTSNLQPVTVCLESLQNLDIKTSRGLESRLGHTTVTITNINMRYLTRRKSV